MQCKLTTTTLSHLFTFMRVHKRNLFGSCEIKASVDRYSVDTRPICRPSIGRYVGRHIGRYTSETMFVDNLSEFKLRFIKRGYPKKLTRRTLSEVNFATRQSALLQNNKTRQRVLPFVTTYQPSVRHLKKILMLNWDLIQNQPLLNTIFRNSPIKAYSKRGTSFKDMLVRAKL